MSEFNSSFISNLEEMRMTTSLNLGDNFYPLSLRSTADLENNFYLFYRHGNTNLDLLFPVLSILWTTFEDYFEVLDSNPGDDDGVVISYGIKENQLVYVMRKITFTPKTIIGVKVDGDFDQNKYLVISGPNQFEVVDEAEGDDYIEAYKVRMYINNFEGNNVHHVNKVDVVHPYSCFYFSFAFSRLKNDNSNLINNEILFLVFTHGAIFSSYLGGDSHNRKYQTPIIYFKYGGENKLDNQYYPNLPFRCKSLDIGVLCPPDCPAE